MKRTLTINIVAKDEGYLKQAMEEIEIESDGYWVKILSDHQSLPPMQESAESMWEALRRHHSHVLGCLRRIQEITGDLADCRNDLELKAKKEAELAAENARLRDEVKEMGFTIARYEQREEDAA